MPTISDLVGAIRHRDGVRAAVVLGRDGLLIEGRATEGLDMERVAAHAPSVIAAAQDFSKASGAGQALTAVMEFELGYGVVSVLSHEAILLVLVDANADLGSLLFELRRHRKQIGALV